MPYRHTVDLFREALGLSDSDKEWVLGKTLATASYDRVVHLWDVDDEGANPAPRLTLKDHSDAVYAVAFHPLALHLAGAANSSGLFTGALFRGLFIVTAQLHFAVHALTLQLLLERAKSLVDIVVADDDLHKTQSLRSIANAAADKGSAPCERCP